MSRDARVLKATSWDSLNGSTPVWAGLKGFAAAVAGGAGWDLGNVVICSNRERSEETEA